MEILGFPGTIRVSLLQAHNSTSKQDQGNVGPGRCDPALRFHWLVESLRGESFPADIRAGKIEKRRGRRVFDCFYCCRLRKGQRFLIHSDSFLSYFSRKRGRNLVNRLYKIYGDEMGKFTVHSPEPAGQAQGPIPYTLDKTQI